MKSMGFRGPCAFALGFLFIGAVLSGCSGGGNGAGLVPSSVQTGGNSEAPPLSVNQSGSINVAVTDLDAAAAANTSSYNYHILEVLTSQSRPEPMSVIYPADLKFHGGHVLKTVVSHNIYLNAASTAWGDPGGFLNSLNASTFIHVVDQYVATTANGRYKTGTNVQITKSYSVKNVPLSDIFTFIHAAAKALGSGYGNIYHVFIPSGYVTCTSSGVCYSPNNPATFAFCAYHASVTFSDAVGHVLFSVEPYQNVPGCRTSDTLAPVGPQPPPNGQLKDSTDSTLSHEYFESITDPDPASGWSNSNPAYPSEIGDLCRFNPYVIISLSGHNYEIQREYSNAVHGCVD
jgi:hypothetical protein